MSDEWMWRFLVFAICYFGIMSFCHKHIKVTEALLVAVSLTFVIVLAKGWSDRVSSTIEYRRYTVIEKKPPQWFHVTLKDDVSGEIYTHEAGMKHCFGHENILVGDKFELVKRTNTFKNGKTTTSLNTTPITDLCYKNK